MPDEPVCAAVVVHAGRLLLVRRRVPEGSLVWQLPAGKAEAGEVVTATAVRETFEETGLVVEPVIALGERVHPLTQRRIVYVACRVVSGVAHVADAHEIVQVVWAVPAEWSELVPHGFASTVQDYLADLIG